LPGELKIKEGIMFSKTNDRIKANTDFYVNVLELSCNDANTKSDDLRNSIIII